MKKNKFIFFVLLTIILSVSLVSPISVKASPHDTQSAGAGGYYEVLGRFKNNTNRTINLVLEHAKEDHQYYLTLAPGMNYAWVYTGGYNFRADTCGKKDEGHLTFGPRPRMTFACHSRSH